MIYSWKENYPNEERVAQNYCTEGIAVIPRYRDKP